VTPPTTNYSAKLSHYRILSYTHCGTATTIHRITELQPPTPHPLTGTACTFRTHLTDSRWHYAHAL